VKICEPKNMIGRTPEYIADVEAAGHQMTIGQWFKLLRRHKIRQSEAVEWGESGESSGVGNHHVPVVVIPAAPPKPRDIEKIKPICEACKFFVAAGEGACMHPHCGCAASRKRLSPWVNVTACPIHAW